MAKWLTAFCALLFCATVSIAGPYKVEFEAISVETNSSFTAQESALQYGGVILVDVDLSGYASPTCDVSVATSDGRTVLSIASVSADGVYAVRDAATTTAGVAIANEASMIPLVGETLQCHVNNANSTGVVATVTVYMKR